MKVELTNDGLLIVPDTEFETEYINRKFGRGDVNCFVKCGLTPGDLIGIKVCYPEAIAEDHKDINTIVAENFVQEGKRTNANNS